MHPTGKNPEQTEPGAPAATTTAEVGADAEETLLSERNLALTVLDTVGAIVIVLDLQGHIVRVNKACERLSGYAFSELENRTLRDTLLPPGNAEGFSKSFTRLLAGEAPRKHEGLFRTQPGENRLISWTSSVLRNAAGEVEYIVGTGIDITEQRRAEDLARERELELARLQRLYTAGQLAAAVAHEINQPLAAIAAYSGACLEMLRNGDAGSDQLIHNLEQTAQQAQRAGEVIRSLRNAIRMEATGRQSLALAALLQGAMTLVEHEAARAGITMRLKHVPGLPSIAADRVQIEQVLVNLLINAIESIRNAGMANGVIDLETGEHDGMARITVRDNGPGIDAGLAEQIFEPFHSTKPEGLGLGLNICRSIVKAHLGQLWVEPRQQGCAFHFTLPFAA